MDGVVVMNIMLSDHREATKTKTRESFFPAASGGRGPRRSCICREDSVACCHGNASGSTQILPNHTLKTKFYETLIPTEIPYVPSL